MQTQNAIVVDNIVKTYNGRNAVDHISFTVPKGQIFAMLGANGAGKTTVVNMLNTLFRPDEGTAEILGHPLDDPKAIRSKISVTGQFAALDEALTGQENLEIIGALNHLPRGIVNQRVQELLTSFDLKDAAHKLVKNYSGGMKRRLDIAVSLISEPEILFLDEPTTGIDPQNRIKIWEMVRRLSQDKGTTVFLTTQYLEEAEYLASYAVIMNQGKIISSGGISELKRALPDAKVLVTFSNLSELELLQEQVATQGINAQQRGERQLAFIGKNKVRLMELLLQTAQVNGIEIQDLDIEETSLEDVYLHLIGGEDK